MTPHPHDALIKSAFEDPRHAAALLRAVLPVAISEAIDWNSLTADRASFVDRALADRHADLLFWARLRTGEPALLFLLLEHQSTGDQAMPLRSMAYQVQIWERFRKEQRDCRLPPIIAVVISQDPGGWTAARSLEDMLDTRVMAIPGMTALVPQFSLVIDDLAGLSDDALTARMLAPYPMLALWLLRDAHDPERLLRSFDTWRPTMLVLLQSPDGLDRLTTLIRYMFHVVDPLHHDELRARLDQLDPRTQGITMTIAEYLEEKGRMEGRMETSVRTLRRQLLLKFKLPTLDVSCEARVNALTADELDRCLSRVVLAESLAEVFEAEP
jgi:hypothetical protein